MKTIITHPTELAQWHALINDAQQACTIVLEEELESYLVFLLMRYSQQPQMVSTIFATEFLQSLSQTGEQQHQQLRNIGDQCLLISGLFPGRAQQRQVKLSYYVNIGQSAYGVLSGNEQASLAAMFKNLCHDFVALMDVLQTTRDMAGAGLDLLPLDAQELWEETHSQRALEILKNYTDSFPHTSIDGSKKN